MRPAEGTGRLAVLGDCSESRTVSLRAQSNSEGQHCIAPSSSMFIPSLAHTQRSPSGQEMTLHEMRSSGWVQRASLALEGRQPGNSQAC